MYSASMPKPQPKSKSKSPVRKHSGIRQSGPKKGTLKKGYKYVAGEVNMNGKPKIVKVACK